MGRQGVETLDSSTLKKGGLLGGDVVSQSRPAVELREGGTVWAQSEVLWGRAL